MRSAKFTAAVLSGLISLQGCNGVRNALVSRDAVRPKRPVAASDVDREAESPFQRASQPKTVPDRQRADSVETVSTAAVVAPAPTQKLRITPIGHEVTKPSRDGFITIDGRTFAVQLIDQTEVSSRPNFVPTVQVASQRTTVPDEPFDQVGATSELPLPEVFSVDTSPLDATLLNLPTALSMVGGDHPAVGFARWRVQEAYADFDEAQVLWLPSLQTGFSFHKHDGNYQASNGDIVDVNRNSFQYGLGAGATGAGTTPTPGLRAQFHLADAIFQPNIAQKNAWASGHAENVIVNRQLRDVALAYLRLLDEHQQLGILQEVRDRTAELSQITDDFAGAGQGLQADADRMRTELNLLEGRITVLQEQVAVASSRLAHALSADPNRRIIPMDATVVPVELVSTTLDQGTLISSGLAQRPELKELQALVAAACDRYQRQKYAPFVPSVLLGFSTGGFGGGTGTAINNVDDRYDFDAMITWEIRNLGMGERSARRRSEAQVQQAMYHKVRMMDDVAREIAEAHSQVEHRRQRMAVTQTAIQSAVDSYDRNLSRIREGEGLPIEVLQSVQALEASRRAYLDAVIAYNEAQFQLQWALGWHVSAPPEMQ